MQAGPSAGVVSVAPGTCKDIFCPTAALLWAQHRRRLYCLPSRCRARRQKRRGGEQGIAQAWMHGTVPLEPSTQDEEEPRISPWAYAERAGQGRRAQQTLALRDLRSGQISGYSIEPSQA